jgi:Putative MetA-pathway of phenol degradation
MSGKLVKESGGGFRGWAAGAALCLAACGWTSMVQAGSPPAPPLPASPIPVVAPAPAAVSDSAVVPASCASCSSGVLGIRPTETSEVGGCSSCGGCSGCGANGCVPGREPCDCCCDSVDGPGRFLCGIYQCICCPDPCYEPHWLALADASFFQSGGPRPITQTRLRFVDGFNMPFPDKSEFFFPRADGNAAAKGPKQNVAVITGANDISYREFHLYTEAATGRFGASVDMPYRNVSADDYKGASGMGDITIGTKSLLLDCELLQFAFEFNTITPSGNFMKGLGTGHVSLEPGVLMALKLAPETYLQSEVAYRFPLGGDQTFEGPVFHYHFSLNHGLWHCGHGVELIGTGELNGWEFSGGKYTGAGNTLKTPVDLAVEGSAASHVLSVGPGVRLVICDKIDFGAAGYFNLTSGSVADEFFQFDFRWRF